MNWPVFTSAYGRGHLVGFFVFVFLHFATYDEYGLTTATAESTMLTYFFWSFGSLVYALCEGWDTPKAGKEL